MYDHINGLVQERHNSIANALELCLSCANPSNIRGVTIHLVMIRFVLRYTACNTFHDTIFAIHISDILFIQELSIDKDL